MEDSSVRSVTAILAPRRTCAQTQSKMHQPIAMRNPLTSNEVSGR